MTKKEKIAKMDALEERMLKSWKGTPEELGALMYDATAPRVPAYAYDEAFCREVAANGRKAREAIEPLDGGPEWLLMEH